MSAHKGERESLNEDDWERVLSAAAQLQTVLPEAVLVGGTAAALHVDHRFSYDDDHVVRDLPSRYEIVLQELEKLAGWITNRLTPPVLILGNLAGVDTGIRNLIREKPLEVETYHTSIGSIVLPTLHEMTRIKAWLLLTRNARRDYLDFVALADRIETSEGADTLARAIAIMDVMYPQKSHTSVVLQLARQLAEPLPKDLGDHDLTQYRIIADTWRQWEAVHGAALHVATVLLRRYETRPTSV